MQNISRINKRRIKYTTGAYPAKGIMTYIFGARCIDGVVLVADRKVTYRENPDIDYREKLYSYYYPIVVGSSGSSFLFDRFREDALLLAQKYQGTISIYDYMSDIREKIREYYKLYRSTLNPWDFDILFAAQTQDKGAILKHIYGGEAIIDDVIRYKVIGSESGRARNSTLLEPMWHYKMTMTMEKAVEFGYFMIRYIEKYDLDNTIGTGKEKPQIWHIPDKGRVHESTEESVLNTLENKVQDMLEKNEKHLKALFGL